MSVWERRSHSPKGMVAGPVCTPGQLLRLLVPGQGSLGPFGGDSPSFASLLSFLFLGSKTADMAERQLRCGSEPPRSSPRGPATC